jgi:hypothetical protein
MKISRINTVLKRQNKRGYIKYIKSLSYREYETIFMFYINVFIRLENIHNQKERKRFSKSWFKSKMLKYKYNRLHSIFVNANATFMIVLVENLSRDNEIREKLLKEMYDINSKININKAFSTSLVINDPPTEHDVVNLISLISNSIYFKNEIDNISKELENLKNKKLSKN